jgi:hypothetical protein
MGAYAEILFELWMHDHDYLSDMRGRRPGKSNRAKSPTTMRSL